MANVTPWEEYQQVLCNKSITQVIDTENKFVVDSDEDEDEDDEDDDIVDDVLHPNNKKIETGEQEDDYNYDDEIEDEDEEEIKLTDGLTNHGIVVEEQSIIRHIPKSSKLHID